MLKLSGIFYKLHILVHIINIWTNILGIYTELIVHLYIFFLCLS
jgi:hypothetical protein